VAPLTDETKLQNLNQLPFSSLRKEFRDQVMTFRKALFGDIKIKKINNKEINGNVMVDLLKNYINAINNGVIPNIENAYNQVTKFENDRL